GPVLRHSPPDAPAPGPRSDWPTAMHECRRLPNWSVPRRRRRLLERAIDAGARDLPRARNARQTITAGQGGRECLAHRLGLLWSKGRLPSSAAILAQSSSLSMVISPTLDFSRAISS